MYGNHRLCALFLIVLLSNACADRRLTGINRPDDAPGPCVEDTACGDGFICAMGECVDLEQFACRGDDTARVEVNPVRIDFGEVTLGTSDQRIVTIKNDGECNLTVDAVGLSDSSSSDFGCSPCDLMSYPKVIPPRYSYDVTVTYAPTDVGAADGELLIRSDAGNVDESGIVTVALDASYSGKPDIQFDPAELNFGYISYTAGQGGGTRTETVRVMNVGSGNALARIEFIYLRPGSDFIIPAEFTEVSPSSPLLLRPYEEGNPDTWLEIPVTYTPTGNSNQENLLTLQVHLGDEDGSVERSVPITGSSLGPPAIHVDPTELVFRDNNGDPLVLGRTEYRGVNISNIGQSPLIVELGLDDTTGDFTFSPSHIPPLPAGATVAVAILYTPTATSDPSNPSHPQRSVDAFFRIVSNDADNLLTSVPLRGWAQSGVADDLLKVEMTFQNNDSSWAQEDLRNVDLELESPIGYSCKKPRTEYAQMPDGSWGATNSIDFCGDWTATGLEGTVNWIPGGVFEEPERIILYGLGQNLANNQDFVGRVHYVEDCAFLMTGTLSSLTGFGISTLLGILGGAAGVPIAVDPGSISDIIDQACYDHASSLVNVTVYINGQERASRQITLQSQGDAVEAFRIHRQNGAFEITQ